MRGPERAETGILRSMPRTAPRTPKELALRAITELPDDATTAQILDRLVLRMKVERGRAELAAGKGIPHAEARRRLAKWLA